MLADIASREHVTDVNQNKKTISKIASCTRLQFLYFKIIAGRRSSVVVAKNNKKESREAMIGQKVEA